MLRQFRSPSFIIIATAFCLCIFCDFWIARATLPDADAVQNFNELGSVFSNNIFLRGWVLASDNFYGTDLPFYVVGRLLFGNQLWLIYAVPTVIFALLLLAAVLLVVRARPAGTPAWPGALMVMYLIGIPVQPGASMLLISDFHTATIMFCLFALLIIQPVLGGGAINRWMFVVFTLVLFVAEASDPFASMFFGAPLFLLLVFRFSRRSTRCSADLVLLGCVAASIVCAEEMPSILSALHGFTLLMNFSTQTIRSSDEILLDVQALFAALRILFNAQPASLNVISGAFLMETSRFLVEIGVLISVLLTILRLLRAMPPGAEQLLAVGGLFLAILDVLSANFYYAIGFGPGFPNAAVRYVVPVFMFLSIAATMATQTRLFGLSSATHQRFSIAFDMVFGAFFIVVTVSPVVKDTTAQAGIYAAPQYKLAQWLKAQHYRYGVGDYFTTQLVRALSKQEVMADPVTIADGLVPLHFETDTSRFDAQMRPQFFAYSPKTWSSRIEPLAIKTYGPPSNIENISGITVLILQPER